MDLSKNLIAQFAKTVTPEKPASTETSLMGTIVESDGDLYVQFDGTDLLTPAESTIELAAGQRVTVTIKDHRAVVTGCLNDQSITRTTAEGLVDLFAHDGIFSGTLSAARGEIGGWTIGTNSIQSIKEISSGNYNRTGMISWGPTTTINGAAFFAGCSNQSGAVADPAITNFWVTHGGKLYAKNATLYGDSTDVKVTIADGLTITNDDDTDMTLGNVKVRQADGTGGYMTTRLAGNHLYFVGTGFNADFTCDTSGFSFDRAVSASGTIKSESGALVANDCTAWNGGTAGGYISTGGRLALVSGSTSDYPNIIFVKNKNTSANTTLRANNTGTTTYTLTLPNSTGTLAVSSSDIRLKKNVKPARISALDVIDKINLYEFDWLAEGKEGAPHWKIGMIADELEKLDKNLVFGGGENEDGSMNVKGIDTVCLLSYLVGAVQEQAKEIVGNMQKIPLITGTEKLPRAANIPYSNAHRP